MKLKSLIQAIAFLLIGTSIGFAQETQKNETQKQEQLAGFDWLKQFEGTWKTVSKTATGDSAGEAAMECQLVGSSWIVIEHKGDVGGMNFHAIQTVSFDSEKSQYVGNWIDSTSGYRWSYSGSLDESGQKLFLEADGPDWTNPEKIKHYRDVYEFISADEIAAESQIKNESDEWETFLTSSLTREAKQAAGAAADEKKAENSLESQATVTPFLMFIGQAEAAIEFYQTVFDDMQVESMNKYKAGEAGKEGSVQLATIVIEGQRVKCIDSPPVHDFDFTPSFSFFVECENETQLEKRFTQLSEDGKVMMPLGNYGFSQKFGWVSDKFGVSWQLNLK